MAFDMNTNAHCTIRWPYELWRRPDSRPRVRSDKYENASQIAISAVQKPSWGRISVCTHLFLLLRRYWISQQIFQYNLYILYVWFRSSQVLFSDLAEYGYVGLGKIKY